MAGVQPARARGYHTPAESHGKFSTHRVSPYFYYGLLLVVVISFALVRLRLRDMPLERDEGEYAYAGQLLLQGLPPYQFVYSVKLPGTYAAYAVILGVFGQSAAGIHVGLLVVNAATIVILFFLAKRLLGNLAGIVAAASYALLSTGPYVNGLAGHATHFVVLFATAAIWLLLEGLDSTKLTVVFCAGLLLGLALLMKQPGLVFTLWAALYVLSRRLLRPIDWRLLATQQGALWAGVAAPFAITCLLMLGTGEFHNFWFWTFSYVRHYGSAVPVSDGLMLLYMNGSRIVLSAPGVWLISLAGLTAFAWNARARANTFFVFSLLLFSLAGVSAGLYFRPHYFILMLPVVSILAGVAVGSATENLLARATPVIAATPALLFLIAFLSALYLQRQVLFQMDPVAACEALYPHNPFPEALEVSKYIRAQTGDGDTIAVLGSEPEIYFYSHRRSATGFVYMYPLLEPQNYALPMQQQMMQEIESSRPRMLVLVNVPSSWVAFSNIRSPQTILDWVNRYAGENYVIDGIAEMGKPAKYTWGEAAEHYIPTAALNLLVLRRKGT